MFETRHSKQSEQDQSQAASIQKTSRTKQSTQHTGSPTRVPLYTQLAWGNLPPPWLRLPSPQTTQEKQPLQRQMNEELQNALPFLDISAVVAPQVENASAIRQFAQEGVQTPASTLPFAEQIQQAFGQHEIKHIQAHLGSQATASAEAMQASAYAMGNHVAFSGTPDLYTVAHEAAHVVQQRGGVQLAGGIGKVGDIYEQHADTVAKQVTAGQSVEHLLDEFSGTPNERLGTALHANTGHYSTTASDSESPTLTNLTQFTKQSDSASPVQFTEHQPVVQMQKKIRLGQDIPDWLRNQKGGAELLEEIEEYNNAVEAYHKRPLANSMEGYGEDLERLDNKMVQALWRRLQNMLEMAREIYSRASPLQKDEHLYSVTQAIRDAQAHIRPPDQGLPMLTMLPWGQMETLGIATSSLSVHFENIHPEHSLNPHERWGPPGMREKMAEMKEKEKLGKHQRLRFLYVVLTKPGGGNATAPEYKEVYELVFTYNVKDQAIGHMDLAGGHPIAAGGELECYNGTIKMVDNSSGHYIPNGPSAKQAAINAFKEAGLGDISLVYKEKIWFEKKWQPKEHVEREQASLAAKKRRQEEKKK